MKIIALADLHGNLGSLEAAAKDLRAADVALLVGDLTQLGHAADAAHVVQAVRRYCHRVLAVPGNCDYPDVGQYLDREGINLHRSRILVDPVAIIGSGGSLPCPGTTPNESPEDDYRAWFEEAAEQIGPDASVVLVSHQPPIDTKCDITADGSHVGGVSVREFIEEVQPLICFTGHIHEAPGIDRIGKTRVVNPGPLAEGGYAWAEVNAGVDLLEIRGV